MKNLLKIEEFPLFCLSLLLFSGLDYSWDSLPCSF